MSVVKNTSVLCFFLSYLHEGCKSVEQFVSLQINICNILETYSVCYSVYFGAFLHKGVAVITDLFHCPAEVQLEELLIFVDQSLLFKSLLTQI